MGPPPPGTPAGNGGKFDILIVFCFLNGVLPETPDGRSVYSGEPDGLKTQMGQLFDAMLYQIQWGVRVFLVLGGSGALFNIEGGWDHLVQFYIRAARTRGIPTIDGVRYYSTAEFHSSFHLKRTEATQKMFAKMYLDIDAVAHVFYPADRERLLVAQHLYQLSADPVRPPTTGTPVVTLDEVDQPERAVCEKDPYQVTSAPVAHVDTHTVTFIEPDAIPEAPTLNIPAAVFVTEDADPEPDLLFNIYDPARGVIASQADHAARMAGQLTSEEAAVMVGSLDAVHEIFGNAEETRVAALRIVEMGTTPAAEEVPRTPDNGDELWCHQCGQYGLL